MIRFMPSRLSRANRFPMRAAIIRLGLFIGNLAAAAAAAAIA